MLSHGALLGSLVEFEDRAAVAALPEELAALREYGYVLNVFRKFAVTLLVYGLDLGDVLEHRGKLLEALFMRLFRHALIHLGPLAVLTGRGGKKVGKRVAVSPIPERALK